MNSMVLTRCIFSFDLGVVGVFDFVFVFMVYFYRTFILLEIVIISADFYLLIFILDIFTIVHVGSFRIYLFLVIIFLIAVVFFFVVVIMIFMRVAMRMAMASQDFINVKYYSKTHNHCKVGPREIFLFSIFSIVAM